MGLDHYHAKRGPDFEARINVTELDNLETTRWDYGCLIRFPDAVAVPARLVANDLIPGETLERPVVVRRWNNEDRRLLEAGMQFEILKPVTTDADPRCIGQGHVIKLRDPYGRSFFADAEANVLLFEATTTLSTLNGRPLEWKFTKHNKFWHGHIDATPVPAWSTARRTAGNAWLCFYDLWKDMRHFPESGHPLMKGDAFEVFDDGRHIGQGTIMAWSPKGSKWGVCYPLGWKIGAGVIWRRFSA
jgi:hypothetical protein